MPGVETRASRIGTANPPLPKKMVRTVELAGASPDDAEAIAEPEGAPPREESSAAPSLTRRL
jgi:hypothetical protein